MIRRKTKHEPTSFGLFELRTLVERLDDSEMFAAFDIVAREISARIEAKPQPTTKIDKAAWELSSRLAARMMSQCVADIEKWETGPKLV